MSKFTLDVDEKPGKSIAMMEQEIAEMEAKVEEMKRSAERERVEEIERVRAEAEAPRLTVAQAVSIFAEATGAVRSQAQVPVEEVLEETKPIVAESRRLLKIAEQLREEHAEEFAAIMHEDEAALLAFKVNQQTVSNLFRVARDAHGLLNSTVYVLSTVPKRASALATSENKRADLNDLRKDVARARQLPEDIAGALRSVRIMSSQIAERLRTLDVPAVRMLRIVTSTPRNPDPDPLITTTPSVDPYKDFGVDTTYKGA